MSLQQQYTAADSLSLRDAFAQAGAARRHFRALVKEILDLRPDLANEMVYFPEQGGLAYTVFIGDEVFKAPLSAPDFLFSQEAANIKRLQGRGLPIPQVTCTGRDFYGMTRLPGVTLRSVEGKLSQAQREAVAGEIVDFIHGVAQAARRDSPQGTEYGMHGDLHGNNILVDPQTGRLTGVVDFGHFEFLLKERLAERSHTLIGGHIGPLVQAGVGARVESLEPAPPLYKIREIPKGVTP